MKKKKIITSAIVLTISLTIAALYQTFATDTTIDLNQEDLYLVNLESLNTKTVTIPANSTKTVMYRLQNTSSGRIRYAVGYTTNSSVSVKVYSDSESPEDGIVAANEYKYIKLFLENNGGETSITLSTILGYERGGDLIVPSGITLVSEVYTPPVDISKKISELYDSASKTTVSNNSISYNYATSVGLMNDRLGGTTQSLDGGNIRYYGADPNNYIYFNCSNYSSQTSDTCELWRIIGVFNGRAKIVRGESIGTYSWDSSSSTSNSGYGVNNWSQADVMKLLNSGYESESVGGSLYYNGASGNCYSGRSNATTACDFTSTGLKNEETRWMIDNATWNLGGIDSNLQIYSDEAYQYERGSEVPSGQPSTWIGGIGLIYPSDYGYATDFSQCTQNLYNYNNSTSSYACRNNDWLHTGTNQWMITNNFNSNMSVTIISSTGRAMTLNAYSSYPIIPTLYLKKSTLVVSGTGTSTDPYKLEDPNNLEGYVER